VNERQRDLFLYNWSRRRAPGQQVIALRGLLIGAVGGLAFALIMMQSGATPPGVTSYDFLRQLMSAGQLLVLSVPAFAFIGWFIANRVFAAQEAQYQALISAGHQPPAEKPAMTTADRWPAMMIGVVAAVIAGFILYLFWAASTGNL
jgi:hypothetical protein